MKVSNAIDSHCPACKATLKYNTKLGLWKCEYCDSKYTLNELKNFATSNAAKKPDDSNADEYVEYKCKDCGAKIITDKNTSSTFCVYCGNTAILKSRLVGEFAPSKIIPFKNSREDAIEAFKGLKKGRPLLPDDFISENNIEKIRGIYIPFWLYDIQTEGELAAVGENISSWNSGEYRYTRTDVYSVLRNAKLMFANVPVDGSEKFDNSMMNTIEPFDFKELVDYNHAYLSGFLAEKYDVSADNAKTDAIKRCLQSALDEYKSTIHYSSFHIKSNDIKETSVGSKYVLLPVWMVNVKYNDKYYLFAMNGQTGEFVGDMPISKKKLAKHLIISFVLLFIMFFVIIYIFYKKEI